MHVPKNGIIRGLAMSCAAIVMSSQIVSASPKSDSIVAFTGSRTKILWQRLAWCNADYTPRTEAAFKATSGTTMLFDTDEGVERALGTVTDQYPTARISRSGLWATVTDKTCTYIFTLTGTNPNKRVFLDKSNCTYWAVKAWGRDSTTGIEYAYALDNYDIPTHHGTALYKIPVKADGTANVGEAIKIPISGSPKIESFVSISADMKKVGGLFPWPENPAILDVATGALSQRKNGPSCYGNLALDNSYRFFHLNDDHVAIKMWDKALSSNQWEVTLANAGEHGGIHFCNNSRFATTYAPSVLGDAWENGEYWGWSAAAVKSKGPGWVTASLLQKFSADFRTIERSMAVSADIRYFEVEPDVWMANGYTGGGVVAAGSKIPVSQQSMMEVELVGRSIRISPVPANAVVRLMDARGRVVAQRSGAKSIDIRNLDAGVYVVSAITSAGRESRNVTVAR